MTAPHTYTRQDLAAVRRIAEAVPDPELVVVTVGDLGIVRDIRLAGETVEIDVTPTYSACPATLAIELEIETAVNRSGHRAQVRRVLSPAWTTDWITDDGRRKMVEAGIAPPGRAGGVSVTLGRRTPVAVPCPRCESSDTELVSAFGSTACKALHRCRGCGEPFDHFKAI